MTATASFENYLSDHSVRSWLLTTDHKRIGLLYLLSIIVFFAVAAVAAAMMRLELLTPQGDLVTSETYNKLFTIHGVLMVWFFLIPSIPAVLGNFVIPMMIGARDVAFPKLNLLSWYLFMAGGGLALYSIVVGGVDSTRLCRVHFLNLTIFCCCSPSPSMPSRTTLKPSFCICAASLASKFHGCPGSG